MYQLLPGRGAMTTRSRRPTRLRPNTVALATSGVEGWAEQHILDLLRSDVVPHNMGDIACTPQHAINPHLDNRTPAWY